MYEQNVCFILLQSFSIFNVSGMEIFCFDRSSSVLKKQELGGIFS